MRTPTPRSASAPSAPADNTKQLIVQTALRMFSEHGLEGVSLSELREASGQNNRSAIHYHFGNKEGLLDAVTNLLHSLMDANMQESLTEARQLAANKTLTLEQFVRLITRPYVRLYLQGEQGRDCIRLLSHMCHDVSDRQQERAFTPLQNYLDSMAAVLQSLLPDYTPQQCAPLMYMTCCTILEVMTCSPMLTRKHTLAGADVNAPQIEDLIEMFLTFASGGLRASIETQRLSSR